jgi:thiol-disulfide isomerase/thioredoxin
MKTLLRLLVLLGLLRLVPGLHAQTASASADADFAAFAELLKARPPGSPAEMGFEKYEAWLNAQGQKIFSAGMAFYSAHPDDVRRWEVVVGVAGRPPRFTQTFGPDVEKQGSAAAVVDVAAKAVWDKRVTELQEALLASTDAPAKQREIVDWGRFTKDFHAMTLAKGRGEPVDFSGFRARFAAHVARYAELDVVAQRASVYLGALERNLPDSSTESWRQLANAPNAKLREVATARLHFLDLISKPLDIAFTDVEGRAVDLKALRGKVVLIDFWATWCGPCIAELPNIRKVYADYHDKGFEIVGIALENGKLQPSDNPEQTATKLATARKVLNDFTAKENMPWPQYFDGKWWKNDISTRYDIKGIPAMFLLDQEGKVVTTSARGEKLEAEVKRLLRL